MKNLGIDTKNSAIGDFVEKLQHVIFFSATIMLIYGDLCKLGGPVVFKS